MKRIAIATAVFCALVLPAAASAVDANQNVTITVSKALEASAGSAVALGSTSPSGSSNVNADSGSQTAATLRSNAAWTASLSAASATMGEDDARTSGSLANSLLYSTNGSSYSAVPTSSTQVTTGSRNSDNNTQTYSLYFRQPVSWADEAGSYILQLTNSVSN